jgi:hypothetical protein
MRKMWLLITLAVTGMLVSCSSNDAAQKCVSPLDCDQAFTCVEGKCQQVACETITDCEEGSTCALGVDPSQPEEKFCTPVQCNNKLPCPDGYICNDFSQCVSDGGDADIEQSDVVEGDGTTEPEDVQGSDVSKPGTANVCKACTNDADCDGDKCHPLGGGKFCFSECASHDDCSSGWMCYQLTNESQQCIPMAFNCDPACLNDGCPEGEICNQETGECKVGQAECGMCQQDWDCDDGFKCYIDGGYCAPSCGDGCPANSTCQEVNNIKVSLCVSAIADCCYGDICENPCSAPTPFPFEGNCVECLNDIDCGEGKNCDLVGHTCVDAACAPPTPYQLPDETCVECTNNGHCAGKGADYVCDMTSHTCKTTGPMPEECSYCVDPYPACAEINGVWSCVQCSEDSYCPGGICDLSLYACDGGGGGCGVCSSDNECISVDPAKVLKCDSNSGCCYDAGGFCDDVESFCDGGNGSECMGLMELLMGGMGGLPGMPEGSAGGVCTCDEPLGAADLMCLILGACPAGGCLGSTVCIDPSTIPLLGDMFGPMLGGINGVCLDPSSLLGMLGGGLF